MLARPSRAFPGTAFYLKGSALLAIAPYLVGLLVYSAAVTWIWDHYDISRITLTTIPFTLIGLALSIFLGFRNNACYDRWWEARKLWGAQINTTRYTSRMVLNLVRHPAKADEVSAFHTELVYRVIAFTHVLRLALRQQLDRMPTELEGLLPADEISALADEVNPANAVLQRMGDRLMDAYQAEWIHPQHVPILQEALNRFADIQGACERIKNTPVPLSYTMLTHRIVATYCLALPFGIVDKVGEFTPLVVGIVAFAFLGLDAVGTQIEDPFEEDPNDLPLHQISVMIERNLRQRLGETDLPEPIGVVDGILV